MITSPKPPPHDGLEALIKEARARQLRRRLLGTASIAVAAAIGLVSYGHAGGGAQRTVSGSRGDSLSAASCGVAAGWRLSLDGLWSEPTGQHTGPVRVRRVGSRPCTLEGYPKIALIDASGRTLAFRYSHHGDQVVTSNAPRTVHVGGGGSVFFMFNKYRCDIRAQGSARRLRVKLPGVRGWLTLGLPKYPLMDYCPTEPPSGTVAVSPLVPKLLQASFQPGQS